MLENLVRWLVYLVLAIMALSVPYALLIRPWLRRWGSTDEEVQRRLPGDDLVPKPDWVSTRAITIAVPPAKVWRWLAQIGYHRAGWYSYDFLHRLMGVAGSVDDPRRSAKRIVPELQRLRVGDAIRIFAAGVFTVRWLNPPRLLLLTSGEGAFRLDAKMGGMTWLWLVEPTGQGESRLLVRTRSDYGSLLIMRLLNLLLLEPGGFLMERKTLLNLRRLAEREG